MKTADNLISENRALRDRITLVIVQSRRGSEPISLTEEFYPVSSLLQRLPAATADSALLDLIITHNEVNRRHGTGVLLKNMFANHSDLASMRVRDDYSGEHDFGSVSYCLPSPEPSRVEMFDLVGQWLRGLSVRRILCVPYYSAGVLAAVAAKEILDVPLCTYIMDDANIHSSGIPDDLMNELLRISDLRLAISPELRTAYETKYRRKFWLLPPTVEQGLIAARCNLPAADFSVPHRGVLIGNIWAQRWLDRLIDTIKGTDTTIDWYCNNGNAPGWLEINHEALTAAGIALHESLPEVKLASALRGYSFAILPSGILDGGTEHRAIAQLSLPTRVPFITATSNVPIIVLGSPDTAAARFVNRFKVGVCCDYDSASLSQAIRKVTDRQSGAEMRRNAFEIGRNFSSQGILEWVWSSIDKGEAADERFEGLMPLTGADFAYYVDGDPPKDIHDNFVGIYQALKRLKNIGYAPDFVMDIGASNGVWSFYVRRVFPAARFILVEPLASRYKTQTTDYFLSAHPEFEMVETAVSDRVGAMRLNVSSGLYGSSLFATEALQGENGSLEVPVTTVDALARSKEISGRGLLKLDVQFAEYLVLAGAQEFLSQIDLLVLELTLRWVPDGAKNLLEMLNLLDGMGFGYFDDVGEWRSAINGTLEQKDILFVRKGVLP